LKTKTGQIEERSYMTKPGWLFFIFLLFACGAAVPVMAGDTKQGGIPPVPTLNMVTMLDLGANKCVPCKMMAPIIEELKKEYAGLASIIFIDVWEHNDQVKRFGIRAIPTQIFYDETGKEVRRHVGFMDKKSIVAVFDKLGVRRPEGN